MGVEQTGSGRGEPPMNPGLATPLFALAGLVVILFASRIAILTQHRWRLHGILKNESQRSHIGISSFYANLKKHVLYAPLFTTRHNREFRLWGRVHMGTVPLRLESAILAVYLTLNIIFLFVLIDWEAAFGEKMFQLKYAAGHLAVMNTPALVITAGRNNPLIPLLGIRFDTFNLVHRWVGRLIAINSVIHMGCVLGRMEHEMSIKYLTDLVWNTPFFIYGLVSLIGFLLIFFQAMSPLRHAWYETFLHLHILLAIMAFVALWYHLQGLTQQRVLLGTIVLWGLERLARLVSLFWRNFGKQRTTAIVEVLPGDVARVDVAVSRAWKFKAGQYLYLYMPTLGLWTSHPFSVAWTSTDSAGENEKRNSGDSLNTLLDGPQQTTMSCLVKGRDGFTKKLLNKASRSEEESMEVTAFAEGPFGGLHSLSSYGTVMLIAGGIGITHPMSYLYELVNGVTARSVAVRKVSLIWVVRSMDHLTWIQSWMTSLTNHPLLQGHPECKESASTYFELPEFSLSIQIYVTASQATTDDYITSDTPWAQRASPRVPICIEWGKPDFGLIVESAKAQQVGAMAVSVCGPGGMGDDVRSAVRSNQGGKIVDLYEESFSW